MLIHNFKVLAIKHCYHFTTGVSYAKYFQVQDTHQCLQDASVKLLLQLLTQWRLALQLQGKMRGGVEVCIEYFIIMTVTLKPTISFPLGDMMFSVFKIILKTFREATELERLLRSSGFVGLKMHA